MLCRAIDHPGRNLAASKPDEDPHEQEFLDTRDGKYHKLKVEAIDANGNPLTVEGKKGKQRKTIVYAREGYTAPTGTVGD